MSGHESAIHEIRQQVAAICDGCDIKVVILPYSDYSNQKQSLLSRPYSLKFPADMAWLYDPDSWRQDWIPQQGWDSTYRYVALLEGTDRDELSERASRILAAGLPVGLIILYS
jgi:hypothetical protein